MPPTGCGAAERIRRTVQKTVGNIIEIGQELLAAKESVGHGHFEPWLRAEFSWTKRTAQNFMSVAERFGGNTQLISHLPIDPTAAYLLAAPSAPDGARQTAVERAEAGERITTPVAREILAAMRNRPKGTDMVVARLGRSLKRYRARWNPKEFAGLAQQLRAFADELEKPEPGGRKKARG